MMNKAFKFQLKPTPEQEQLLVQIAGNNRWLWNYLLAMNIEQYKTDNTFKFKYDMHLMLPELKENNPWLGLGPSQSLQQKCDDLDKALRMSFKSRKKKFGFPKFKKKGLCGESFRIPQSNGKQIKPKSQAIKIPKLGWVTWIKHRPLEGKLKSITIKQEGVRWYVVCLCSLPDVLPVMDISESEVVGIDVGLKDFAVTSDGEVFKSVNVFRNTENKLARAQRSLSRKTKGSANRNKQRKKVAVIHTTIKNKRRNFINQTVAAIAKQYKLVFVEDLNIAGMKKNRCLSKSISDQGWGMFAMQLKQKLDAEGGHLIKIGRYEPSTKTCSHCGTVKDMPLSARIYSCDQCGLEIDRDLNAAINIKSFGISNRGGTPRIHACGEPAIGEVAYDTSRYDSLNQESFGSLDPKPSVL
jgi:putative transposase